ncbi:site-2 protease family protein [soil metagenome]
MTPRRRQATAGSVSIGRLFGVRILVHVSWFIIFGLVVVSLSTVRVAPGQPPMTPLIAIVVALLFFASVIVHEMAHALVARGRGMVVQEITLFIFGGAANFEQDAPDPRTEAMVAGAGPIASVVLGAAFFAGWALLSGDPDLVQAAGVCLWLGASNLLLAAFNLVPGFPMDGGRLLRALVWSRTKDFVRATRIATLGGRGFAYLLIALGVYLALTAEGRTGPLINGIWLAFIGWFLNGAAEAGYRRVTVEKLVEGISVEDVMDHEVPVVGPNLTLDTLVDQHLLSGQAALYPVTLDGDLVGTIDLGQVSRVPRGDWENTRVTDVMARGDGLVTLTMLEPLWRAVTRFEESGTPAIPVVDEETRRRLIGLVTRDGVFRALRARAQLRSASAGPRP